MTRPETAPHSHTPSAGGSVAATLPGCLYWAQDDDFRLTRVSGTLLDANGVAATDWLAEPLWALPLEPLDPAGWEGYRERLTSGAAVEDLLLRWLTPTGEVRFLSVAADRDPAGGYCAVAHDVSALVQRERSHRVERAAGWQIASAATLEDALPGLIQAICESLGWACGVAWKLDSGETLRMSASWATAHADPFVERLRRVAPLRVKTGGLFQRACASGTVQWVDPVADEPALACLGGYRHTMRSALFLPIVGSDRRYGLLACFSRHHERVDGPLRGALDRIAAELGAFVARSAASEQLLRFRAAMDVSGDQVFLVDRATMCFLDMNQTAISGTGYTREELLEMGPQDLIAGSRADVEALYDQVIAAGKAGTTQETIGRNKQGDRSYVEIHRRAVEVNGRWLIVSISRDVFGRRRAEMAERRLRRMFATLSATNDAILRVKSAAGLYRRVCNAAVNGGGFLSVAVIVSDGNGGTSVAAAAGRHADKVPNIAAALERDHGGSLASLAFRTGKPVVSNHFLKDERVGRWHELAARAGVASAAALPMLRDGTLYGVLIFHAEERNVFDPEIMELGQRLVDNVSFALDNLEHEAERRMAEERIQYLATHDALTGLPNRVMFTQILEHAVESAQRYGRRFAVMFIDLDRFKVVNDSFGHAAGDRLLIEMADRLRSQLRASDVVARLGGDEFVMMLENVESEAEAGAIARKLLTAVLRPMSLLGHECRVTTSIGIALYPGDGDGGHALMKNADLAMYSAKKEGKNNYQFYSHDLEAQSLERLVLETSLRSALDNDELRLEYQAQIDVQTQSICGVEALLRWDNPELGAVAPAQFIPVAEETGLIVSIGRWVLQTACAQSMAWQRAGLPPVCVAVNLSARQFASADLLDHLREALDASGLDPALLELEITEGMVMQDPPHAVQRLQAIKRMGVRLAIDDFGTGYSSLGQIKSFPVDTIKVDRSFIRDLPVYSEDRAITEAIIAMAHTLSLTVIAEGVETGEQVQFLRDNACDEMQGYYFSRPVRPDAFAELLRKRRSA